jgi:hypothetical protein
MQSHNERGVARRLVAMIAMLVLVGAGLSATAYAQSRGAPPPIGTWRGTFSDGGSLELTLQPDGACTYQPSGYLPIIGVATWTPSAAGGILDLRYTSNAGLDSHAYYSVVYVNRNTIILSDPYFKIEMHRL